MEFELDDYRTGRINKKVKNLNCINSTGYNNYNFNKKKIEKIEKEKIKTENNNNKNNINNNPKAIYVNSKNNNYLITKLKKENESLRLILLEYESDIIKYKINEKKCKQKKIENPTVRITRKSTNVKPSQQIMKGLNNISNYANNTFTTNFYHPKNNNKFNSNNNSLLTNNNNKINETQSNSNSKIALMNSYLVHNKKIVNNNSKKSLSVFRSSSKNKSKKQPNRNIYDKIKTNYKKINNGYDNIIEIKNKDIKQESNNSINNNNTRINTLNNNINNNNYISSKNVFTYKKKVNQNSESRIQNNICNTERKQETNITSSNTNTENNKNFSNQINFNRNTVFIPKQEFNLTWSRFSKKDMETSFENYIAQKSPPQSVIMSSKNIKKIENRNNKYITNAGSKKYSVDKFDNYNLRRKPDINPQKITINRRIITNKMKNNKNCFSSNNVSMKNIINIRQKNERNGFEENKNINKNAINTSASNKMMNINNLSNDGEIYTHKKKNSMIDSKNIVDKTDEEILKKNSYNNKYNVTINNINNCNYYNLIQGANKPEIKIIKKRINKNI